MARRLSVNDPKWLERDVMVLPFGLAVCTHPNMFEAMMSRYGVAPEFRWKWLNDGKDATLHLYLVEHMAPGASMPMAIVCMRARVSGSGISTAGLLVHEAVHVFQKACELWGEIDPSKELEAYSIQWISQQLMWEFARQTGVDK